jgi:RNA polymerase sigma-70 factor (ECF subfamily)
LQHHAEFQRLVMAHLDAGYNLARWLAQDPSDAEDVVQDACMRAMKYIGSMRGDDARAWFLSIVRHAFYDWLARNRPAAVVRDDAALEALVDEADGPEASLARKGERLAMAAAVARLPLPYREVIVLRELEELSYKQIAVVAQVPLGTVMSRLARARRQLRGWLDPAIDGVAAAPGSGP